MYCIGVTMNSLTPKPARRSHHANHRFNLHPGRAVPGRRTDSSRRSGGDCSGVLRDAERREVMTPAELVAIIEKLPVEAPISDSFEQELFRIGMSDRNHRWYKTQKEHWLGWLREYSSP